MSASVFVISTDVKYGKDVIILPGAIIGKPPLAPEQVLTRKIKAGTTPVSIGDNTVIGANAVIYDNVTIGKNCLIGDFAFIREGSIIGDNTIIGVFADIGYEVIIGSYVRVMDRAIIVGNSRIGDHVFVSMGVVMTNDPDMGRKSSQLRGPTVECWSRIGAGAVLLPNVTIGCDSLIGSMALVTKDVLPYTIVYGQPAKIVGEVPIKDRRC